MKLVIAFAAIVTVAYAASISNDRDAVILKSSFDNIGLEGYNYEYETSNGISAQEQAQVQNAGRENEAIAARGQFSYTGPDGVVYSVSYIADENGFQPSGAHLPS
ncbi:Insect cuticle protein [Popillia japonica]|uniref:Insect cuticle protein n=1 Tax=Popillia japonica TaxID=7064 RepID=A0AAW1L8Y1_POPJA